MPVWGVYDPIVWRTFPARAQRVANGRYLSSDVGRIAFQRDEKTYWRLSGVTNPGDDATPHWEQVPSAELPGVSVAGGPTVYDNIATLRFSGLTVSHPAPGIVEIAGGGGGSGITIVRESDGFPSVADPVVLEFENATVSEPFSGVARVTVPLSPPTNLGYVPAAGSGQVTSSTGSPATIPAATTIEAGLLLPAEKTVLNDLQNVAANRLLGREGTAGVFQEIQVGSGLTLSGGTLSASGGGGAPVGASYVTAFSESGLTNERVATNTATVEWDFSVGGQARAFVPDGAITTVKIADDAVTAVKLANNAVTTVKIADDAVTTAKLANAAVTTVKLADGAVTYSKIQNVAANRLLGREGTAGVIQEIQIGTNLTLSGGTLSASGGATNLGYVAGPSGGQVTSSTGSPATIPAATTIEAGLLLPGEKTVLDSLQNVTANRLLGREGTAGVFQEIRVGPNLTLSGGILDAPAAGGAPVGAQYIVAALDSTLTNERVATNTATVEWDFSVGGQARAFVPDGAITTAKIADDAVTTGKLVNAAVTTAKIADGAVTYSKIQNVSANRLLGREGTAGVVQEIQIGSNLSLTGGVLSAVGSSTNLGYVPAAGSGQVTSSTGSPATIPAATTSEAGLLLPAEKTVLNGLQNVTANRLLGREGTAGVVQEIQVGSGLTLSGGTLSASGGGGAPVGASYITASGDATLTDERVATSTATVEWDFSMPGQARAFVPDGAITYVKIQNVAANRLLGREGTAGVVQEIQVGSGLTLSGGTLSASGGGATNLSYVASPSNGVVESDTGADATIPLADTVNAGLLAPAEKVKLNHITVAPGLGFGDATTTATDAVAIGNGASVTAARTAAIRLSPPTSSPATGDLHWLYVQSTRSGSPQNIAALRARFDDVGTSWRSRAELTAFSHSGTQVGVAVGSDSSGNVTLGFANAAPTPIQTPAPGANSIFGLIQSVRELQDILHEKGLIGPRPSSFMAQNNPSWINQSSVNGSTSFLDGGFFQSLRMQDGSGAHKSWYLWDLPSSADTITAGVAVVGREGSVDEPVQFGISFYSAADQIAAMFALRGNDILSWGAYDVGLDGPIDGNRKTVRGANNFILLRIRRVSATLHFEFSWDDSFWHSFHQFTDSWVASIGRCGYYIERDGAFAVNGHCYSFLSS